MISLAGCADNGAADAPNGDTQGKITDIAVDITLPRNAGVRYKLTFTAAENWKIYPYEAKSSYIDLSGDSEIRILNSDYNMDLPDWCTVSPSSGEAGRAEVMLTLTANDSQAKREAKFVVEAAGDKVIFTVIQTTVDKSQMPEYDDSYEDPENPESPEDPGTENPENPPLKPHITFDDNEFARLCLLCYDTVGDGGISEDEIADITSLDERFGDINTDRLSDLRYFPSLKSLTLTASSTVRSVDLGYENKIERVSVSGSVVEEMDLSGCGGITEIACGNALSLNKIALPAAMPSLSVFELENTAVEELAIANAPALRKMEYVGTLGSLRSLRLDNVGIETLTISGTPVETVRLSNMPGLKVADMSNNARLTDITITGAEALTDLSVADCAVTQTDLTGAPSLVSFRCDRCPLQSLDLSVNREIRTVSAEGVPDANGRGKLNIYVAFDAETPEIIPEDDRIVIKIKTE